MTVNQGFQTQLLNKSKEIHADRTVNRPSLKMPPKDILQEQGNETRKKRKKGPDRTEQRNWENEKNLNSH